MQKEIIEECIKKSKDKNAQTNTNLFCELLCICINAGKDLSDQKILKTLRSAKKTE